MTLCPKCATSSITTLCVDDGSGSVSWVGVITISTDDSTDGSTIETTLSGDSLKSGVLSLERSSQLFVGDDSAADTGSGVLDALAGGEDLAVSDVVSDDWFLNGSDDFIRLWLDHLDGLDLIGVLRNPFNVLKGDWLLGDVLDVLDGNIRLRDPLNVVNSNIRLRDELGVLNWVGWWLYPVNVLNWIRLWLHPFKFFNWVGFGKVALVVRDRIRLLRDPLNVVNFVRWWLYPFSEFFRDWVGNDNLNVLNWDWLRLDPFSVLNRNVLDGGDWIRLLRNPFKPLHVVRLGLEPLGVRNWVGRVLVELGHSDW